MKKNKFRMWDSNPRHCARMEYSARPLRQRFLDYGHMFLMLLNNDFIFLLVTFKRKKKNE